MNYRIIQTLSTDPNKPSDVRVEFGSEVVAESPPGGGLESVVGQLIEHARSLQDDKRKWIELAGDRLVTIDDQDAKIEELEERNEVNESQLAGRQKDIVSLNDYIRGLQEEIKRVIDERNLLKGRLAEAELKLSTAQISAGTKAVSDQVADALNDLADIAFGPRKVVDSPYEPFVKHIAWPFNITGNDLDNGR